MARSLDLFIRLEKECRGDGEAEGLGRLEIADALEPHRLLHGQGHPIKSTPYLPFMGAAETPVTGCPASPARVRHHGLQHGHYA